ncbi:transcriptional repressor [Blautia liquoris]|uniref:Transcriptional repressor n=1 Tax=Blautia liquoris TaxID=2779518 RepID=A0A7M2RJ46_9FIRM|nr:transcriptional repressor [Blautia liquoris]QOV20325.1 transcriptional repressor [Blautia liquoris]
MIRRKTIQCDLVLQTVNNLRCHATADEIYETIVKEHPRISKATVYRNLQRLCEMGEIRKREFPGGADRYDHICSDHYHARCVKCGRVFDVDMEYMKDIEQSIRDDHGFIFTGHDIIFKGICKDCSNKQQIYDADAHS